MTADPRSADLPTTFEPLRSQLLAAAESFSNESRPLSMIIEGLVDDVERACAEPLEIFPVCHHSPSSAAHLLRRLKSRPPRAIYMECCEDLRDVLDGLRDCTLPVALQAFSSGSDAFPAAWSPLNLVCPLTEFSAEFQAVAYALENPETELIFVDRSSDHVFQWLPQESDALEKLTPAKPESEDEDSAMHGSAVGVEIGKLVPTFDAFHQTLLKNARVRYFSEWWDRYVEEAVIDGDESAYRHALFLIGSLFRRLGARESDRLEDESRERYMWTRIKQHLRSSNIDPRDALHICGASHAASRVAEFGVESDLLWEIPPKTETKWLHGLVPSSYGAICRQFGHPTGTITMAEARWKKSLARGSLRPFTLKPRGKKSKSEAEPDVGEKAAPVPGRKSSAKPPAPVEPAGADQLLDFLRLPPPQIEIDDEELLQNSVRIVELARRHGYLSSTADAIAVYQTATLLANLRDRKHPTPYDFRDAAVTCIEKDTIPGKRDVHRLCEMLFGGDRVGRIGFDSLPPLAKDVYERLAALPISLEARTIQRALLDFTSRPDLLECSDLLWKLAYLLAPGIVRPIMGQRTLGHVPKQESWDVAIGKHQGAIIELGYEGINVEHVIERRLKKSAFGENSRVADALEAAEESILFLRSERLTEEIGERAVELIALEPDVSQAKEIHERGIRLVHYYRSIPSGLPSWASRFVTTAYSHYATLLPNAFSDRGVSPEDLASMLRFIFSLESLALSLGCERSQLVIAIKQSQSITSDHPKLALLWSTECMIRLRDVAGLRDELDRLLENELTLPSLPDYLGGFLLALAFTPIVGGLTVELLGKTFERLPDRLLMPWLPKLLRLLRPHADSALPTLVKEAAAVFPANLAALSNWTPSWHRDPSQGPKPDRVASPARTVAVLPAEVLAAATLLRSYRRSIEAHATSLGLSEGWSSHETVSGSPVSDTSDPIRKILISFPGASAALSSLLDP